MCECVHADVCACVRCAVGGGSRRRRRGSDSARRYVSPTTHLPEERTRCLDARAEPVFVKTVVKPRPCVPHATVALVPCAHHTLTPCGRDAEGRVRGPPLMQNGFGIRRVRSRVECDEEVVDRNVLQWANPVPTDQTAVKLN